MTDPEVEHSTRESMYWVSEVEGVLENISYWLTMFRNGKISSNDANHNLEQLADQLADLGWHGWKIPF